MFQFVGFIFIILGIVNRNSLIPLKNKGSQMNGCPLLLFKNKIVGRNRGNGTPEESLCFRSSFLSESFKRSPLLALCFTRNIVQGKVQAAATEGDPFPT